MNRVVTGITDGGEIGVSFPAAPFVRLMVDVVSGFAAEPTPAAGLLHDAVALLLPTILNPDKRRIAFGGHTCFCGVSIWVDCGGGS